MGACRNREPEIDHDLGKPVAKNPKVDSPLLGVADLYHVNCLKFAEQRNSFLLRVASESCSSCIVLGNSLRPSLDPKFRV